MDQKTFESFYTSTNALLYGYIRQLCDDPVLTEDIVQDSYLKFLKKPPMHSEFKAQKAYLYTIASRLLADHYRKMKKEEVLNEFANNENELLSEMQNKVDPLVMESLKELGHHDKSLLWLAYVDGYNHREIGKVMGIKSGSVKVLLFRARQRFKELLDKNKKKE